MINKIEEVMEYINKIFNELGKEKIEYYMAIIIMVL